jgi:hypothetical protein
MTAGYSGTSLFFSRAIAGALRRWDSKFTSFEIIMMM